MRERRRTDSDEAHPDTARRRRSLLSLVRYATTLMKLLRGINQDAFQNFQLRVGVDAGAVVAGVIGTSQPHYDLWGDTVNMGNQTIKHALPLGDTDDPNSSSTASRLESTGVGDRIHMGRQSARLLQEAGVATVFRDRIRVKGKHRPIPTHFLLLNADYDIRPHQEKEVEITRL